MLRKSMLALVLSVSMILSPLSGGGSSVVSAAVGTLPTGNEDTLPNDGGGTDSADSDGVSTPDGETGSTVTPDTAGAGDDTLTPDGAGEPGVMALNNENEGTPAAQAGGEVYYAQNFDGKSTSDISTIGVGDTNKDFATIASLAGNSNAEYLNFTHSQTGGRALELKFATDGGSLDVSGYEQYIVEFDTNIVPSNQGESHIAVMSSDAAYVSKNFNWGIEGGYLLKLGNQGANSKEFNIYGNASMMTIENTEWVHCKVFVDKTQQSVSTTITKRDDNAVLADKVITAYNGNGNATGLYLCVGRTNGAVNVDNVVVRAPGSDDEFGESAKATVSYDMQGHGDAVSSEECLVGGMVTKPADPTVENFVFLGWYKESTCTTAWNFASDTVPEGGVTLYAKWIADPAESYPDALYSQTFGSAAVLDPGAAGATCQTNDMDGGIISADEIHGYYFSHNVAQSAGGGRWGQLELMDLDLSGVNQYTVEFDAAIKPGNNAASNFGIKCADGKYLLKLANAGASGTEYTINDSSEKVTIPSSTWCHYLVETNKTDKTITLTVTNSTTNEKLIDQRSVSYGEADGDAKYIRDEVGKCVPSFWLDNVVVKEAKAPEPAPTITGKTSITMKSDASVEETYTVSSTIADEEFTWTVAAKESGGSTTGISIAADGKLTVAAAAAAGTYVITATSKTDPDRKAEITVTVREATSEPVKEYLVLDATGNETAIDSSAIVPKEGAISGYQITTATADEKLVSQEIVAELPATVDTTGAAKVEIAPVYTYEGKAGASSFSFDLAAGNYDFIVYNKTNGERCDVYLSDESGSQMLLNNMFQYGNIPDHMRVHDIVHKGSTAAIEIKEFSSGHEYTSEKIKVDVIKVPDVVARVPKMYVLGDSLVAIYYNGGSKENTAPQTGWGQVLQDYLTDDIEVVDLANSGVTAVGLEGTAFSRIRLSAQSGDIFLLESGYNDKAAVSKGEDDADGTNMKAAVDTMVTEAKAKGLEVILVSPNASAHDYGDPVAWSDKMEELATKHSVKYLDLSELSYNFLKEVYGENDPADNAVRLMVSEIYNIEVELKGLHSNYNAAQKWASLVAQELKDSLGHADLVKTDVIHWFDDGHGNVVTCSAVKGQEMTGVVTVTYDMQGHGVQVPIKKVLTGSLLVEPTISKVYGYTFEGWYTDKGFTNEWNFATNKVTEDTILYAKWTQKAGSEVPEEAVLYFEDFEGRANAGEVGASSGNAPDQLKISKEGDPFGDVLFFDFIGNSSINTRNAVMKFGYTEEAAKTIAALKQYVVEFDAFVTPGNRDATNMAVMGADAVYATNGPMTSGYLFDLRNAGSSSTEYKINENDSQKATIPSGTWCHYTVYVDQEKGSGGMVSTTITRMDNDEKIVDKALTSYSGKGIVDGFYMCSGRYGGGIKVNDILVRTVLDTDEFGELTEEALLKLEFGSQLNQIIRQPALDSPVHQPIIIKVIGDQGSDLSGKATITWSMGGMDEADGYVSLTKEAGTGEGTTGVDPDGATAYFNVRNGVKNLFGYVKATVTYGNKTMEIMTPVAVLGDDSAPENRLAPKPGYPVSMDSYGNSLVGYVGTETGYKAGDLILNNWSIYGSNGARSFSLEEVGGKKALKFASNGGGSTVAVYQWTDQTKQYVVDLTVQFTAPMTFGVYADTPNNGDRAKPEWTVSYTSGALNLGTDSITGINANEWHRLVVSADPSIQKVSLMAYDSEGTKLGEIEDMDMANPTENHRYFSFTGTWPMYLNSFEAYNPILGTIKVNSDSDTVKVPDAGNAAAELPLSATLLSTDGLKMTGTVTWSLPDENPGVEIVSDGKQGATLKISPEASGTVRVVASMDGKTAEKVIQLTTSSNVVSFKTSTGSITIPFDGEAAVARTFEAVTLKGDGSAAEDGGAITYSLLGKDGMTALTSLPKGVTFENGVLTVAPGASPVVLYVRADNEQGLSSKVKVNIHGLSFAFGSADPVEGFTQVTNEMYNSTLGFGFVKTEGLTVNGDNVTGTDAFCFKAKVPNGNYTVKVDTTAASMTSEVVESVPAVTGITKSGSSFNVAVCDGVLDLTFPADSSVKTVEISQMAPKAALDKPMVYAIGDSTTSNSDSPAKSWGNCVADGEVTIPAVFSGFANHGKAGDDSVGFYNSGRVENVLLAICPGDYVTVNMGINSRAANEPASYYTLLSEYYVEGILQRGGIPVMVTATPDGPVGDRLNTNYNAATGKFTNSRGDTVHIADLRDIAEKKGLHIIELGQWGEDWMNTLTVDDVNVYNGQYGTSFTTVLEMVQDWYKDHNHYKPYLAIKIGDYILGELAKLEGDEPDEPGSGEIIVKPVPEGNAPATDLKTTPEEMEKNLTESGYLDSDALKQIENGAKCEVSVSIKDADTAGTVTAEEKQKVADVVSTLGSSSGETYGMAQYIDISLSMKLVKDGSDVVGSEKELTNFNQDLVLTITIPDNLINTNPLIKREYIIIRVHKGEAKKLETEYSSSTKELTFRSNLFSTYALVTRDTVIGGVVPTPTPDVPTPTPTPDVPTPTPTPGVPTPTPTPTPTPAPGDTGSDESDDVEETGENVTAGQAPKTGDTMDVTFTAWFVILAAALAGTGAVVAGKRRREE